MIVEIWNLAPSGSATDARRPKGVSSGSRKTLPPNSTTLATAASVSSAPNYTCQNDGTSAGRNELASIKPATTVSPCLACEYRNSSLSPMDS